jgi:hypothetical protein
VFCNPQDDRINIRRDDHGLLLCYCLSESTLSTACTARESHSNDRSRLSRSSRSRELARCGLTVFVSTSGKLAAFPAQSSLSTGNRDSSWCTSLSVSRPPRRSLSTFRLITGFSKFGVLMF